MLTFPQRKHIRAGVIADYVQAAGFSGVVVFTCGNAARALRERGLDVLEIGPHGVLLPGRWWTPAEIHRAWPALFDATSGHLPAPLMVSISKAFRDFLGDLSQREYDVPTGSGETITCLRWAYPDTVFLPVYSLDAHTKFEPLAPLNYIVRLPG